MNYLHDEIEYHSVSTDTDLILIRNYNQQFIKLHLTFFGVAEFTKLTIWAVECFS